MRHEASIAVGILHGAGYAGGELLRLLLAHPFVELRVVTSRSFAGEPLWRAHPTLRGATELGFTTGRAEELRDLDVVFIAAEHGRGAAAVVDLIEQGYAGRIVDLSADFRFNDPDVYPRHFGFEHPAPELLGAFQYGMPELYAPYAPDVRYVANPGCFATALALALHPLAGGPLHANVTALTGASGSGARPREGTHFPTRDGNVRAYKVLAHQHAPEVEQVLGPGVALAFVPVSGPWTRGIWGTAHVDGFTDESAIDARYTRAYGGRPFVRLYPGELPEMRFSVGTPFFDVGWVARGAAAVVGFALDNLLKGAASQAVQNMNLLLGLPEEVGLIPDATAFESPIAPEL